MRTKAPPPFSEVMYGKRQMLPSPTAEPVAARMKASRDDHMPCMDVFSMISDPRMIFVVSELAHHCAPRAVGVQTPVPACAGISVTHGRRQSVIRGGVNKIQAWIYANEVDDENIAYEPAAAGCVWRSRRQRREQFADRRSHVAVGSHRCAGDFGRRAPGGGAGDQLRHGQRRGGNPPVAVRG